MGIFSKGDIVIDSNTGEKFPVEETGYFDDKRFQKIDDALLLKKAAERSAKEATEVSGMLTRNVAVPVAQAGLAAATGGMSIPAQMLISGGAELASQALGLAPESKGQIALATGLPGVGKAIQTGVKGAAKTFGKLYNPGATRQAGVEAVTENLGATPNIIKRAYRKPASKMLYEGAESTFQEVPTNQINRAITSALNDLPKANPPESAITYLQNLSRTLDREGSLPYEHIQKEIKGMYRRGKELMRKGETEAGHTLLDTRKRILAELDKISPELSSANATYKREQSLEKISKVLSNPRPNVKLGELITNDSLVKSSISKDEAQMAEKIAKQLATMGTEASPYSAVTARYHNAVAAPLTAMLGSKTGMAILRKTFQEGKVSPAAISAALQFWRAYEAQGGDE